MKILMQSRPKQLWIGGDMVQLEKTSVELEKLGHEVIFNDEPLYRPALLLSDHDIVHTWNFSMRWTKYQIWAAHRQGIPVVCSMIYHEGEQFVPYNEQQAMLDSVDACIFLTEGEVERVKRHLTIPEDKIHIIPNGIDTKWFVPSTGKKYVLTIGRLDGSKGQIETALACKELGVKYLCVGEIIDENYAKEVKNAGAEIIPPKTPEELIPIYQKCSVYVLASKAEVMPLTVMEAGAIGKNIVLTNKCEWQIPVTYVDPTNHQELVEAIRSSLTKEDNVQLKDLLQTMTWEHVAKQIDLIYKKICKK